MNDSTFFADVNDPLSLLPPSPAPGTRGGYYTFTPMQFNRLFWQQGGTITPHTMSTSYIVITKDYLFEALRGYHKFLSLATGYAPQHIYKKGVFVCVEYAKGFDFYLDLCHMLHWSENVGRHKIAVGWGANKEAKGSDWTIPDNHAFMIVPLVNRKGEIELCGAESQLTSIRAEYGKLDCSQFWRAYLF